MSITTMEALTALPEGAEIRIRSRQHGTWRATKDGAGDWLRSGSAIPAHFFIGYVTEGRIDRIDNTPIVPGDWLSNNRYTYFVVDELPDGRLHTLTWYRSEYRGIQDFEQAQISLTTNRHMARLDAPPDAVLNAPSMQAIINAHMEAMATLRQRLDVAPPRPEKDDAPPQERVVVTVHVNGRSNIEPGMARAAVQLPRSAEVTVPPPVDWSYQYRYAVEGTPETCPCQASLDLTKVEAGLPPGAVSWNARASCVYGEYNPLNVATPDPF